MWETTKKKFSKIGQGIKEFFFGNVYIKWFFLLIILSIAVTYIGSGLYEGEHISLDATKIIFLIAIGLYSSSLTTVMVWLIDFSLDKFTFLKQNFGKKSRYDEFKKLFIPKPEELPEVNSGNMIMEDISSTSYIADQHVEYYTSNFNKRELLIANSLIEDNLSTIDKLIDFILAILTVVLPFLMEEPQRLLNLNIQTIQSLLALTLILLIQNYLFLFLLAIFFLFIYTRLYLRTRYRIVLKKYKRYIDIAIELSDKTKEVHALGETDEHE